MDWTAGSAVPVTHLSLESVEFGSCVLPPDKERVNRVLDAVSTVFAKHDVKQRTLDLNDAKTVYSFVYTYAGAFPVHWSDLDLIKRYGDIELLDLWVSWNGHDRTMICGEIAAQGTILEVRHESLTVARKIVKIDTRTVHYVDEEVVVQPHTRKRGKHS